VARGTRLVLPGILGAAWVTLVEGPLYAAESIKAGSEYADCKSALEGAGYHRVDGT
jgi:hypothetical protein